MQEYYTLDANLQRDELIQGFESIIWTERFNTPGDFQIVTKSTPVNKALLAVDTWITRGGSTYVAIIDTVTDAEDQDGIQLLTVTGKFLEQLLDDRVAMPGLSDTTTVPNWVLTGTPRQIMQEIFDAVCVRCVFSLGDSIPYYTFGTLLPTGNLEEPGDLITVSLQPQSVLSAEQQLAQQYSYGFRFVKEGETGHIYFEIYVGNDRTRNQSLYPPVIFDPDLGNLSQTSSLTSKAGYKNVAYVLAANGAAIVYAATGDPTSAGSDRRVLLVNSSNSDDAGFDLDEALQTEGQLALAAQRPVFAFDGQLPPDAGYIYGVDYNLGDLIEENEQTELGNRMVVTEQIFSSSNTGETAYPTLTLLDTIIPGSWNAWRPSTQAWQDVNPTLAWEDLE